MNNRSHGGGGTAIARRLYLHVKNGGKVTTLDMSHIVRFMEQKDQDIADLRGILERVRQTADGMREYVDSCTHPSEMSKGNAAGYWHAQLEEALSQPAAEQPAGDWRCPNCGYIDARRVTFEETCDACHQPVEWDESRIDVIGQNGNDGDHYADAERESLPPPLIDEEDYDEPFETAAGARVEADWDLARELGKERSDG